MSKIDLGRIISDRVQEAIRTGDFSGLKDSITSRVEGFAQTVSTAAEGLGRKKEVVWHQGAETPAKPKPAPSAEKPKIAVSPFCKRIPGMAWGTLLLVLGIAGVSFWSLVCVIRFLQSLFTRTVGIYLQTVSMEAICILVSTGFWLVGSGKRRLGQQFKRYRSLLKGVRYFPLDRLAHATSQTREKVAKNLRRMIAKGMFTEAYLDEKNTTLMLDRETYEQYLALEARTQAQQAEPAPQEAPEQGVVAEGKQYLTQIREANDAIPEKELSAKLDRLELVTAKIFDHVELHPEKVPEIRKFMNYYLPTTLKLVNAYRQFDAQPVSGGKIASAKQEIRDVLDTINTAFENFLDELFASDVMDISTDISALETVLAQDGLTEGAFSMREKDADS